MEYLLYGNLKIDKKNEFYALRVKNKDQEKTKGFFINDEDNPDMPFSRKQWASSIENQFYEKHPTLMFYPMYIDKKEYAFFFNSNGDKQKKEVLKTIEQLARFKMSELEELEDKEQNDEFNFTLPAHSKKATGFYLLKTIKEMPGAKAQYVLSSLIEAHLKQKLKNEYHWMQERKEISKHPFQNYMCPSLDTPKAELGEELSFTNSVISVLINIDLNFLTWIMTSLTNKISKMLNVDPRVKAIFGIFEKYKKMCEEYEKADIKIIKNEIRFWLLPTLQATQKLLDSSLPKPVNSSIFGKNNEGKSTLDLCLQAFHNVNGNRANIDELQVTDENSIIQKFFGPKIIEKFEEGVESALYGVTIPMKDLYDKITNGEKDIKLLSHINTYVSSLDNDETKSSLKNLDQKFLILKLKYEDFTENVDEDVIKGIWKSIDLQFNKEYFSNPEEESKLGDEGNCKLVTIITMNIDIDETNEIQRRFQSLMLIEDQWYLQSNYLESSGTFDELKSASIFKNFFPLILIYQIHHNEIYEEIEEEKERYSFSQDDSMSEHHKFDIDDKGKNSSNLSYHTCNEQISIDNKDIEVIQVAGLVKKEPTRKSEIDTLRKESVAQSENVNVQANNEEDETDAKENAKEKEPLIENRDKNKESSAEIYKQRGLNSKSGSIEPKRNSKKNENNKQSGGCCNCTIF